MVCFFRTLSGWAHICQLDAASWSVPVYSAADKNGTLTVCGEYPDLIRCWCVIDGRIFFVEKSSPSNGSTVLTVRLPFHAFDRDIVYGGDGTEELGEFLQTVITDEFVRQSDPEFAMPYLTVRASGETNADLPYIPGEVYSLLDVFQLGLEKGLSYAFETSPHGLILTVAPAVSTAHNLFWDNRSELISSSVSRELVTKVTVRRVEVTEDEITAESSEDYYWHEDGSVSTSPPFRRLPGIWSIVSVEDEDIDLAEAAAEAMQGNNSAFKITFRSDLGFAFGDTLTCSVFGEPVTARITSCTAMGDDPRYEYELGDMPLTLTDKFSASRESRKSGSVTVEGSDRGYVADSGGTVGGDLTVNGGAYASTLQVGSSSYGSALPATGKPGQVFFKI